MGDSVINNQITINRGDTFERPLFLNKGTELKPIRYELKTDDRVYLAITEPNQPFENAILKKVYGRENTNINGDVVIRLESEDTESLIPGQYYYTIKAEFVNNYKILNNDIVIDGRTILAEQTRLAKGSTCQGQEVKIPQGQQYYVVPEGQTLELDDEDIIAKYSMVAYQSIVNGEQINTGNSVNTVVPRTNFKIVE
jgi:hypothetical protein